MIEDNRPAAAAACLALAAMTVAAAQLGIAVCRTPNPAEAKRRRDQAGTTCRSAR